MVRQPDEAVTPCSTGWIYRPSGVDLRLERAARWRRQRRWLQAHSCDHRSSNLYWFEVSSSMLRWKLISVDGPHLD